MALVPADDLRHRPAPGARMRDSLFWQLVVPEEPLALQCYLFLSGTGTCGWHVAVWSEDGERLAFETGSARLGDGDDLAEIVVDGLAIAQPEPLRTARLSLDRPALGLDLAFTGSHAPFSYRESPDGLPAWFALDRYEQSGRLVGALRLGERRIELDHPAHRDHSWGARDWRAPEAWTWLIAYDDEGRAVNLWSWRATDGASGTAGYVLRDGRPVPIATAELRTEATPRPVLTAVIRDVEGGATTVRLEAFGALPLPDARNGVLVTESGCRASIDGHPAAGQWEDERRLADDA